MGGRGRGKKGLMDLSEGTSKSSCKMELKAYLVQLGAKKFQNPGIVVCGPPFAVLWSCFGLKALAAAVRHPQSNP